MMKPNDVGQFRLLTGMGRGGLLWGRLDDPVEGLDDLWDRDPRDEVDRPGIVTDQQIYITGSNSENEGKNIKALVLHIYMCNCVSIYFSKSLGEFYIHVHIYI